MRAWWAWVLLMVGVVMAIVFACSTSPQWTVPCLVVALIGGCWLGAGSDVLGDHPEERDRMLREELRRRRGAAGWEKPVKPPRPGSRPGGLPPRRR